MGDGGVACVPSQPIMEQFLICGGKTMNNHNGNSNSNTSKLPRTTKKKVIKTKKVKKVKEAVESSSKNEILDSKSITSNGIVNREVECNGTDANKEEVEEGELGTMDVENGVLAPEKSQSYVRKFELKSEIERGEFVRPGGKWREKGELHSRSWRGSFRDDVEKGEFVQDRDRWRRSDIGGKDDYGYSRMRRHDSGKEKGWKGEHEWTAAPSFKYTGDKEFSRNRSHHVKRPSRYEGNVQQRTPRISSTIVDEESSFKNELSNGKNHVREYSSGNLLKRYSGDSDFSDRKHRGDYDDYKSFKSRKLSDDSSRAAYSFEKSSRTSAERSFKKVPSSARNMSADKYSSRHRESPVSGRHVYDKRNSSPHHHERSPRDRAHYHEYREWSPARREKSPYDRMRRYDHSASPSSRSQRHDHSRSPYDRSSHYGHRNRSPSYSEWSPHDQGRYHERRDRTPNLLEQSPRDPGRPQETSRKGGAVDKRQSHCERKGEEEKPEQKDTTGQDLQCLSTDSKEKSNPNSDDVDRIIDLQTDKDELPGNPDSNAESNPGMETGVTEELVSMEEDMDICNTPPHVPEIVDAPTGKWFYLDLFGVEQGPSRLCDLRRLMEEGVLVSDHFIKHIDSDSWVTVENAVSPLVTANFPSIVSDTVTQQVSPPEAPGNLLAELGDAAKSWNQVADEMLVTSSESGINSMEICRASETPEDLHIDERVGALLQGVKVIPGRELETIGEVLQMSFEHGDWERWGIIEGEHHNLGTDERFSSSSELASTEAADFTSSQLAPSDKDNALGSSDAAEWFSGLWSCKGGDWKRNDEVGQDRSWRKKSVLNDGYPLCQLLKPGNEDPRWQRNDEIYNHSQPRKLDLPPWAFTSPDDWNERVSQSKPAFSRGVKGQSLPVIRINACVVKDQGSFVSEPRMKARGKERYSRVSRPYSSSCDAKRLSEEGVPRSRHMHEQDSQGLWKSTTSFRVPKDHVCTTEELQLHAGDWFYLDGSGHECGPLSFAELQMLADQGVILKHSSVFRKVDRTWVPVSMSSEDPQSAGKIKHGINLTATDASGVLVSGSVPAFQLGCGRVSSVFHDLHPQFIGYTRGKLHELVMKSYKSREFAAAINEFLDPWINARQPKKEMEKHIYNSSLFQKSDQLRASKRPRVDGSEDEDEVGDVSCNLKNDCSFEELCGDAIFHKEDNAKSEIGVECWGLLDGHVLARVFHFLRADLQSLVNAALTCKSWRCVVKLYKTISTQIDLCSIAENCSDSMIWSIMNGYNKEKIKSLIVRGCTNISSGMLEEVLRSFPHLSLIDIRGCSQFDDLACNFPNVNWVRNRGSHSKIKSLKQITDATSSSLKTYDGLSGHIDESSGLRNYLESSDKRESSNQLFRRSLYKRSKLFDARKTSSILSRDAHLRRLAMRKYENGYRRMAEFISSGLKDIMKQNDFEFFVPKVAEIEDKMKSGYYASRGLSAMKEDISRMCRDAIRWKNRGNARDMNRVITLFIQLAASMDGGSKSYRERDEVINTTKEDSPPGFSSASSKYKKALNKVTEKKYINRSNGSLVNGITDYGEYASDREIRRRLSKLNRKTYTGSETSDDDRSTDESTSGTESTSSETESDLDSHSESRTGETRGEAYFSPDDELDSLADDREWGARMTKASLVPPVTRKYEVIDQYVIVADEEEVKRKMQVSLPDDYADKLMMQKNGTEESDMEIPEVKDYKPRKQLGNEVIEQEVYGIDPYTHNLLLDSMPEDSDWSLLDKHMFIEDVFLCTLNKQVRHFTDTRNVPMTYPLKPVFEEILETANEDNDRSTMRLCQYMLKAIDSRPEDKYVAYRKGLGVVCNKEGGFNEEDFVVEFLGEVYPSWKWFEKQDGIRSLQKNSKDPAPEFYNIYLERPKGDADGYDLVVVDAMHKANYASRICHSCRPNCEAKVTAVDGQYQIGIYTVRPIRYGEEVTFDYNSVTESKEEYEASVCLCGSQVCRGSYLNLTGEGAFQKVLKQYHGTLDRLQLMLEACELNSVSDEDYIDLSKAGLGSCLLGGLPDWLVAYAARLVRFINFERTKLPDEILKHNVEEKKKYYADVCLEVEKCDAEVQAEGVYNQRLQNLALTLDKVRYVMRCIFGDPKKAPPPLERLSPEAVVSFIWKGEGSLVEDLIQYITPHMDDAMLSELKADIRAHDPSGFDDDVQMELQKSLKWLRDEIRNLQCTYKCRHDAAADLIHIYAHTRSFFRIKEYGTVTSPPVYISPLDLCPKYADKMGSKGHEYCKSYGENYCLGQLIYWYNQTNADPDSCLARASRGCLSLPDIGSFYAKVQKPSRQRVYGPRTVKFMLARMEKQPQRSWPRDRIWSFKSSPKIIGTPVLDAVLDKAPLDKELVHWLKHRPSIFQAMWDR